LHKPGIVPEAQRANALKIMAENAKASEWILQKPVRKTYFLRHLYIKTIILPRQAWDKHRESSKKGRFSQSPNYPKSNVTTGGTGDETSFNLAVFCLV
jgi:hypothetical protein